ncbi:MAG: NAD(P)-binding domain-containing protein [Sphingobacteriaceae bacterium]|nr:NAD(P)-binding domain-containing protein [Cytophagaceae bacterium]
MNIAIIGSGHIGGTLAQGWANAGHTITFGVRDLDQFKGKDLLKLPRISATPIADAAAFSEVILIAATPTATREIAESLGDVSGKIILDAMNSVRGQAGEFASSAEALRAYTHGAEVVKCFNSTGWENMADPIYDGLAADMFMAGSSARGKAVARQLALDLSFANCYDFGGDDKIPLLEQFALAWITLAIVQKQGRGLAFKVLKR